MYPEQNPASVEKRYLAAVEMYQEYGINVEEAVKKMSEISVSMHCWQGDDVGGFENECGELKGGGIMATGNFPGKARNIGELRSDLLKAMSLIPGRHRVNLHAIYLDNGGRFVDRDEITPDHFHSWLDWADANKLKLDFNPTFFSHPQAESGFTLSHPDQSVRDFWIEHAQRCRTIAASFAEKQGDVSVINFWIPDGCKDMPADRWKPRERLIDSYDKIFAQQVGEGVKDAVESKLFGIGSEEYVVGSSEFYLAYTMSRQKILCLDMGHYHPTETIHDKLSAILSFMPEVLLHVSRPVRWDSDHVVIFNDDLLNLSREIVRGNALGRIYLATDFFDASINRIGAWVIGMRSLLKSLLFAMLEPVELLKQVEREGNNAERLAVYEECKTLPYGAIWDYYCLNQNVPVGGAWLNEMKNYEADILAKRN